MSDLFSDAIREKNDKWADYYNKKRKVKSAKEIMGEVQ